MSLRDFSNGRDFNGGSATALHHDPAGNGAGLGNFHTTHPEDREPSSTPKIVGALAVALMVGAAGAGLYAYSGHEAQKPLLSARNAPVIPPPAATPASPPPAQAAALAPATDMASAEPAAEAPAKADDADKPMKTASPAKMDKLASDTQESGKQVSGQQVSGKATPDASSSGTLPGASALRMAAAGRADQPAPLAPQHDITAPPPAADATVQAPGQPPQAGADQQQVSAAQPAPGVPPVAAPQPSTADSLPAEPTQSAPTQPAPTQSAPAQAAPAPAAPQPGAPAQ